jgi:hypothetical protein
LTIYNIDAGGNMNNVATAILSFTLSLGLSDRQLLGLSIIALTLMVVVLLIAWRFQRHLQTVLHDGFEVEPQYYVRGVQTFEEAEVSEEEAGLVVTMSDGSKYYLPIFKEPPPYVREAPLPGLGLSAKQPPPEALGALGL